MNHRNKSSSNDRPGSRDRPSSRDRPNIKIHEEIVYMSEGEVSRRYDSLVRLIEGRGFSRQKRLDLEIDACYVWRELQIRRARKVAHSVYIKKLNNQRTGGYRRG